MCAYSAIMDGFNKKWPNPVTIPSIPSWPEVKPTVFPSIMPAPYTGPTKEQFEELLKLLRAAKVYDEKTGQPECELESKKNQLRAYAKLLGLEDQIP